MHSNFRFVISQRSGEICFSYTFSYLVISTGGEAEVENLQLSTIPLRRYIRLSTETLTEAIIAKADLSASL